MTELQRYTMTCGRCGRMHFTIGSKSTSRSKAWGVYAPDGFRGVYYWTGKGGLSKRTALSILNKKFPGGVTKIRAFIEVKP